MTARGLGLIRSRGSTSASPRVGTGSMEPVSGGGGPRSAGSPGACSATRMVATHGIGSEPD